MKATLLLLVCFLALTLTAAEPPKSAAFEVRLVRDSAAADTELLTLKQRTTSDRKLEEQLHVQKKPLLDRSALKSAEVQTNQVTGAPEIQIVLTESGAERFATVTRQHNGQRLAIVIDGKVYSAPRVMTEISGGRAVISGSFTGKEATQLASRLSQAATK